MTRVTILKEIDSLKKSGCHCCDFMHIAQCPAGMLDCKPGTHWSVEIIEAERIDLIIYDKGGNRLKNIGR